MLRVLLAAEVSRGRALKPSHRFEKQRAYPLFPAVVEVRKNAVVYVCSATGAALMSAGILRDS